MTAIEHANMLTNPRGAKPFGPVSVRWSATRRDWCATNTIEKGWNSTVHIQGKTLADVLGKLNVRVVGIRCDDHSMYYLCEPGAYNPATCQDRVEGIALDHSDRNRLRVDTLDPAPRCRLRDEDLRGLPASRWLLSGGSPAILGQCCRAKCPKEMPA